MKITRVEAIPVSVPLKAGWSTKTAHGEHVVSDYVIVRLHTDDGLVGLGEATVAPRWTGETQRGCVAVIEGLFRPVLEGADPLARALLRHRLDEVVKQNPFTKAAIEMALWDLAGKAVDLPVCRLLGGPLTERIPLKLVVGAFPPAAAVELAERFLQWGARSLKIKVGLDPVADLERVRAIRRAAGDAIRLGIDANGGWSRRDAATLLANLQPERLEYAEQPVAPGDPAALAALRGVAGQTALMADESLFTLADAWSLARHDAVDLFSIYPGKHGGLAAALEIAAVARAAGMGCLLGSNLELGIGTAAMLHLAAVLPGVDATCPSDLIGPLYHVADLLTEPLALGPELASVPMGPGLGVTLDEAELRRFRVD